MAAAAATLGGLAEYRPGIDFKEKLVKLQKNLEKLQCAEPREGFATEVNEACKELLELLGQALAKGKELGTCLHESDQLGIVEDEGHFKVLKGQLGVALQEAQKCVDATRVAFSNGGLEQRRIFHQRREQLKHTRDVLTTFKGRLKSMLQVHKERLALFEIGSKDGLQTTVAKFVNSCQESLTALNSHADFHARGSLGIAGEKGDGAPGGAAVTPTALSRDSVEHVLKHSLEPLKKSLQVALQRSSARDQQTSASKSRLMSLYSFMWREFYNIGTVSAEDGNLATLSRRLQDVAAWATDLQGRLEACPESASRSQLSALAVEAVTALAEVVSHLPELAVTTSEGTIKKIIKADQLGGDKEKAEALIKMIDSTCVFLDVFSIEDLPGEGGSFPAQDYRQVLCVQPRGGPLKNQRLVVKWRTSEKSDKDAYSTLRTFYQELYLTLRARTGVAPLHVPKVLGIAIAAKGKKGESSPPGGSAGQAPQPSITCAIVMERVPGIELRTLLRTPAWRGVSRPVRLKLAACLWEAVAQLQACEMAHTDIKPENIIVRLQLSDAVQDAVDACTTKGADSPQPEELPEEIWKPLQRQLILQVWQDKARVTLIDFEGAGVAASTGKVRRKQYSTHALSTEATYTDLYLPPMTADTDPSRILDCMGFDMWASALVTLSMLGLPQLSASQNLGTKQCPNKVEGFELTRALFYHEDDLAKVAPNAEGTHAQRMEELLRNIPLEARGALLPCFSEVLEECMFCAADAMDGSDPPHSADAEALPEAAVGAGAAASLQPGQGGEVRSVFRAPRIADTLRDLAIQEKERAFEYADDEGNSNTVTFLSFGVLQGGDADEHVVELPAAMEDLPPFRSQVVQGKGGILLARSVLGDSLPASAMLHKNVVLWALQALSDTTGSGNAERQTEFREMGLEERVHALLLLLGLGGAWLEPGMASGHLDAAVTAAEALLSDDLHLPSTSPDLPSLRGSFLASAEGLRELVLSTVHTVAEPSDERLGSLALTMVLACVLFEMAGSQRHSVEDQTAAMGFTRLLKELLGEIGGGRVGVAFAQDAFTCGQACRETDPATAFAFDSIAAICSHTEAIARVELHKLEQNLCLEAAQSAYDAGLHSTAVPDTASCAVLYLCVLRVLLETTDEQEHEHGLVEEFLRSPGSVPSAFGKVVRRGGCKRDQNLACNDILRIAKALWDRLESKTACPILQDATEFLLDYSLSNGVMKASPHFPSLWTREPPSFALLSEKFAPKKLQERFKGSQHANVLQKILMARAAQLQREIAAVPERCSELRRRIAAAALPPPHERLRDLPPPLCFANREKFRANISAEFGDVVPTEDDLMRVAREVLIGSA